MNTDLIAILTDDGTGAAAKGDELIDGSGADTYSHPIRINRIMSEEKGERASAPTEIGFNINTVTATLGGNIQSFIGSDEDALSNTHAGWQDIGGGNLTSWPSGGSSVIKAPYTHVRVKCTSGKAKIRFASNTGIKEITGA